VVFRYFQGKPPSNTDPLVLFMSNLVEGGLNNAAQFLPRARSVAGDAAGLVRPVTVSRPSFMQFVCIASVKNLKTEGQK
jgi:hypothetical protein